MKFFCPRCQATLAGSAEPDTPSETSHITCPGCGLVVDLALADTNAGAPVMPVVRDFTGETLGSLELVECLGSGGMGTVYKAVDTACGQIVAAKLMFPQFSVQPDLVHRFGREAAALRELEHPNIVGFRDEGEIDGQYFIVMEYVDGTSLDRVLRDGLPSRVEAVQITRQICEALAAAHAKGIVHRDLKPANIMLSPSGVKVLDFGIAQVAVDDLTLTRSNAVLGTFNYMAPEQRAASKTIDHRADLFSVGVLLYRMLTGELPIGMFEPPSKLRPEIGTRLDAVVAKLLNKSPEKRHQDANVLLADLDRAARPRRVGMAIAVAALVLLAGGGVYGAYRALSDGPTDAPETADAAQTKPAGAVVTKAGGENAEPAGAQAEGNADRPQGIEAGGPKANGPGFGPPEQATGAAGNALGTKQRQQPSVDQALPKGGENAGVVNANKKPGRKKRRATSRSKKTMRVEKSVGKSGKAAPPSEETTTRKAPMDDAPEQAASGEEAALPQTQAQPPPRTAKKQRPKKRSASPRSAIQLEKGSTIDLSSGSLD